MFPYVEVSNHALDMFNERLRLNGERPYTREEIYRFVRRKIRGRGLTLKKRGDGYALWYRGAKLIVKPIPRGWVVKTVWHVHTDRARRLDLRG